MPLSRPLESVCWIPPALWIAAYIYVSSFDGWGAWAAAPILLGPLAVSLIVGAVITTGYLRLPSAEKRSLRSVVVLILPWTPILHILARNLWRSVAG